MTELSVYFAPHPPLAVPLIGGGNERRIQSTLDGYRRIAEQIEVIAPETILYITPHGNAFRDALVLLNDPEVSGDFSMFGCEGVGAEKQINLELTQAIDRTLSNNGIQTLLLDSKTSGSYGAKVFLDHGVLVPMYYIDQRYSSYQLVHMTSSFQSADTHYRAGKLIAELLSGWQEKVVIVASGDLSHALIDGGPYAYNAYGEVFDAMMKTAIEGKDVKPLLDLDKGQVEAAAQCGLRSFCLAFGTMHEKSYDSEVYSYEGPFGVGYLTGHLKSQKISP